MLMEALQTLIERRALSAESMRGAMRAIMEGRCADAEIAAFLTALRMKGETAEELAAAAGVLRDFMVPLDTSGQEVLDTCGTGGDGQGTFNISTAVAVVAAACGVPVVKHGNRGVSSCSGSSDVLAALGVKIEAEPPVVERCLAEAGIAFCFAPRFHPAMKHVAGVRQKLRFRTFFNLLGPLANPARATYQLLGVGRLETLDLLAEVVARLGTKRAYLVCGHDGLDEVTLTGPTEVREVCQGQVRRLAWSPETFQLPYSRLDEARITNATASAELLRSILKGREGVPANLVLANAAAALLATGRVESPPDGVGLAREAISSGRAWQILERLVELSNAPAARSG